ncbi:AraC family transcriptional regulator [Francisella sp. SYW-9]|uniref:AraC family transcriptional regulator n=1 Tax=Francisella sp. SYW-9 TaxID=2610888 RepID=UPI00123C7CE5|nr:helix-turn-helix transcriptional regulator [Francisella sp. SYW-9]
MLEDRYPKEGGFSYVFGFKHSGEPLVDYIHHHTHGQLMYCSKGVIEIQVSDKVFIIPPGNAVWIPSNVPHTALSKSIVSFYNVYFNVDKLENLPNSVQVFSVTSLIHELIRKVLVLKGNSIKEENITRVLVDLLHEVNQLEHYELSIPNDKNIQSIYEYIINNISKPLLLEDVAKEFAMSGKTLTRLFQKHVGMTFEQWKQKVKILEAISLLSEGASNKQVVHELGYSSESAFIKRFKNIIGLTPREFKLRDRI